MCARCGKKQSYLVETVWGVELCDRCYKREDEKCEQCGRDNDLKLDLNDKVICGGCDQRRKDAYDRWVTSPY